MPDVPTLSYARRDIEATRATHRLIWRTLAPFLGLVVVIVLFSILSDRFFTVTNFKFIAAQTVIVGVCAIGMTFVMIGGGIDLSVGSVVALTSVALALALRAEIAMPLAIAIAIGTGALCGFLNATMITMLRIVPFIATLGMLGIARGAAKGLADNRLIRLPTRPDVLADFVQPLRSPAWWDFALSVWLMLIVAVIAAIVLNMTAFGRLTYALGSNETATRLSGIRVHHMKLALYTLAGMLTGLAGIFQFARTVEGDPTAAVGMELQVIAAVVIGGGSLSGGQGSILGTIIGALMLTALVNGCTLAGWPNWYQEIIIGMIIIAAVTLDRFTRKTSA